MESQNIFQIITSGNLKKLTTELNNPHVLTQVDSEGNNILHHTLKTQKLPMRLTFITAILKKLKEHKLIHIINDCNEAGELPLTLLCKLDIKKNVLVIAKLFVTCDDGENFVLQINKCENNASKMTALHYAVKHPVAETSISLIEILIANGAATIPDGSGYTALHTAIVNNKSLSVIQTLTQNRFLPSLKDNDGNTAFLLACRYSPLEVVVHLCGDDSSILDIPNNRGVTPLHVVCMQGRQDIFEWIVDKCENLNPEDEDGNTPLHYICVGNVKYIKILERMIWYASDLHINPINKIGKTPLHYAAERSHVDAVQILLSVGADPTILDKKANTPKFYAVNNPNVLTLLTYATIDVKQ